MFTSIYCNISIYHLICLNTLHTSINVEMRSLLSYGEDDNDSDNDSYMNNDDTNINDKYKNNNGKYHNDDNN